MFGEASETTLTRYAALRLRLDRDGRVIAIEGHDAGRLCPEVPEPGRLRLDDVVAPLDRDAARQLLDSALRGVPERGVLRLRGRAGVEPWDVASVPILAGEHVAGAWWLLWPLDETSPSPDPPRSAAEPVANGIARQRPSAPAQGDPDPSGLMLSSLRVGVLFEDMQRQVVQVNPAFCELFGLPGPEAITGADCRQAAEQSKRLFADPERFLSRIEELVRERRPVTPEELELADGRVFERDYIPVDGPDGPIGHLWRYQDITERKRTERGLQEAETRYRELVEMLPAVVYRASAVDGIAPLYVSPQIERLLGYSVEEWAAGPQLWERSIHPEDRPRVLEEIRRAVEEGRDQSLEYRLIARDGRVVWVRDEGRFVRNAAGHALYLQGLLIDITEQKLAEAARRQAEERYRLLVEQSPVVVYQAPADDVAETVYVSPQIERLLGYTPDEWLATRGNWARHLYPDDAAWVRAVVEQALATEGRFTLEYRMRRKDGRIVWVQDRGMVLRADPGQPPVVHGVMIDITAQKEAEARLREAEARYRALVEQLPAAVYASAAEPLRREDGELVYPILYVSPQIEAITGYTPEQHVADPSLWVRLVHPDDRPRVAAELRRTDATGEPFRIEYRMLHRDGRIIWVLSSAELLRDENGRPLYWQGLLVDITEQKQAQAALHEAEQRYRTLVEQMPGAVVATEVQPVLLPTGEIAYPPIYVSPQFEVLTGYSAEEYRASPVLWYRSIHPDDRAWVTAASLRTDETGEPFYAEYRFRRKDGEWIWLQERAVLVRESSGEPLYWHCLMLDVTEQKLAELARQEAEIRYRTLVEQLPAAVIVTAAQPVVLGEGEPHYPIVYISSRITDVTGFTPDEFLSTPALWFQRIHPLDRERVRQEALRTDETGEPFQVEYRFQRKDGRWVWLKNHALLMRDAEGRPQHWHGLFIDISERKRVETLVSGQAMILERIAQQAPLSEVLHEICRLIEEQEPGLLASVLFVDQEGRLRHGAAPGLPSEYIRAIEGLPIGPEQGSCGTAAYLGEPVIVCDTLSDPLWAKYRHLAQEYGFRACWSAPVFGSTGEVLATFALYAGEPRGPEDREWKLVELAAHLAGLAIERWREQEQLRYRAGHDLLTGLPNRSLFFDRLEHALARTARDPRRVAVLFIDLDGFKQVNDALGHQAGDDLLAQVARRLQSSVRAGDTVARFAGDEFTVVLEDLQSLQEAVTVAERMLRVLVEPFSVAGRTVTVSASIGIAESRPGLTDAGALLLAADQALYAAKRAGKARYAVAP